MKMELKHFHFIPLSCDTTYINSLRIHEFTFNSSSEITNLPSLSSTFLTQYFIHRTNCEDGRLISRFAPPPTLPQRKQAYCDLKLDGREMRITENLHKMEFRFADLDSRETIASAIYGSWSIKSHRMSLFCISILHFEYHVDWETLNVVVPLKSIFHWRARKSP